MPDPVFHAAAAYDGGQALEKAKVKIDIFEFFGSNIFVNKSQAVRQNSN
ncbi:MAG TPA: hypothetical protein PKJ80_01685 [Candidatus Saccharicenans sp.]|jgi:hypothetical protein|nr:hypothetical protein [Candidatus Saccharicenans sp.]